jgi:hypothetical protein
VNPAELRELAAGAEDCINYAFDEPMVAVSKVTILALADRIEHLEERCLELESRVIGALWLVPDTTVVGEMQALRDKAKRLLLAEGTR